MLALGSAAAVARRLHGGATDFVASSAVQEILRSCPERYEVTGKAGDVLVLHPFVLHSPSTNGRRSLRVIANPMLSVRDDLAFSPGTEARSPLERITQEWALS